MKTIESIAACLIALVAMMTSLYARSILEWTIDDTAFTFHPALLIRDGFWIIELGLASIAFWVSFRFRGWKGLAVWFIGNLIVWQISISFAVLEIAKQNSHVSINGERVGKGGL
jgi:hypothetical protein